LLELRVSLLLTTAARSAVQPDSVRLSPLELRAWLLLTTAARSAVQPDSVRLPSAV
jgi:hypothetical protein